MSRRREATAGETPHRRRWHWPPAPVFNARRMRAIRRATGGDDAETLARLFEDDGIRDDGTLHGRLNAILDATAHRWLPGIHTFLDVPGLHELRGFADRGFRPEYADPWVVSRDQVGHLLTALALALYPARLEDRRLCVRVRDLAGAPRGLTNREVAVRLSIGHEKAPDPRPTEPMVLTKVRRQFAAAGAADAAAFEAALARLKGAIDIEPEVVRVEIDEIVIGPGAGNSRQDLLLTLVGFHVAALFVDGTFADGHAVADWLRRNLTAPRSPGAADP